jgi:hypothetical protein
LQTASGIEEEKGMSVKIKELNYAQRCHMAWRLEKYTACGYCTACHAARMDGNWGEEDVAGVFEWSGASPRSAKIQETKIKNFKPNAEQKAHLGLTSA